MGLVISQRTREKLANKHSVTEEDIRQCFANREGRYLTDKRERHRTDPPTRWFIAETNFGRKLKIAFVQTGDEVIIKTAYNPNSNELRIYETIALGQSNGK